MANNVANVSAGKPAIAGAISRAPIGSTLPTDATTALDAAFAALGYVSEDGVTNNNTPESEDIKAWGGDTVLNIVTSKEDTFTFTLIEIMNLEVLKMVYGNSNVSGTLATGITVKANAKDLDYQELVIDMILQGGVLKRVVLPNCKVSEVGEVVYKDDEAVGYETTVSCLPDAQGNTHYEYIVKPAA